MGLGVGVTTPYEHRWNQECEKVGAERTIAGLLFRCTCGAHPEQYDVFDGRGRQVGYVRLRHRRFTVDRVFPPKGGENRFKELDRIYLPEASDAWFATEDERDEFLNIAAQRIHEDLKEETRGRP